LSNFIFLFKQRFRKNANLFNLQIPKIICLKANGSSFEIPLSFGPARDEKMVHVVTFPTEKRESSNGLDLRQGAVSGRQLANFERQSGNGRLELFGEHPSHFPIPLFGQVQNYQPGDGTEKINQISEHPVSAKSIFYVCQ